MVTFCHCQTWVTLNCVSTVCPSRNGSRQPLCHIMTLYSGNRGCVILGESWLRHHRGIMDYAHDQLWQLLPSGPVPLNFDISPPEDISGLGLKLLSTTSVSHPVEQNLAAMVTEGCRLAQQPWLQLPVPPTQYTELQRQQVIFNTPLQPHLRAVHFGGMWRPPTPSCARVHRTKKNMAIPQLSIDWVMWAKNCRRMPKYWTFWTLTFQGCQPILSVLSIWSHLRSALNSLIYPHNR